jgi:hypothetical protein
MTEARTGAWIETFTGRQFWPLDPHVDDICIEDIAHALSNTCRFNGHVRQFYSVAEHSVFVALTVPVEHRLAALLHDASEAYACDLPRPIKRCVTGYAEAEHRLMECIFEKFGLTLPLPEIVKLHDNRILLDERVQFMPASDRDWNLGVEPLGVQLRGWLPQDAEAAFLETFYTLGQEVRRV